MYSRLTMRWDLYVKSINNGGMVVEHTRVHARDAEPAELKFDKSSAGMDDPKMHAACVAQR